MQLLAAPKQGNWIYPPRAVDAMPRAAADALYGKLNWLAQLKYNDCHLLIDMDVQNGTIKELGLWNRHKQPINVNQDNVQIVLIPELHNLAAMFAADKGNGRYLLDAGLLESRHVAVKGAIVVWDVLVRADVHLLNATYIERYQWLERFLNPTMTYSHHGTVLGRCFTDNVFLPANWQTNDWTNAWDAVAAVNKPYPKPFLEGLMFKNPGGRLRPGLTEKNNVDWMGRSRVLTGRHRF